MNFAPLLASELGKIFSPLFDLLASIIAGFYSVIPNYAVAIALLTIVVMVVTAPLTVKSTKSMLAMQRLQPEMKKLQQKYKGDRAALNEEMMKLYREHSVNPAAGCLPMVIQFPVFFILYDVIRGLTNTITVNHHIQALPRYIGKTTRLYQDLKAHPGKMDAFGINLAANLFSHQSSLVGHLPFAAMVLIAIALQYLQMRQMNTRNPGAAQANPQMQAMQRYMPLIFAVIYLRIAAGVNVYFIVSAGCRIGIQEWVFRSGILHKPPRPRKETLPGQGRRGLMERLQDAQAKALEAQKAREEQLKKPLPGSSHEDAIGPASSDRGDANGKRRPDPGSSARPKSRTTDPRGQEGSSESPESTDRSTGDGSPGGTASRRQVRPNGSGPRSNGRPAAGDGSDQKAGGPSARSNRAKNKKSRKAR